ncbi:MAG: deoxyribodipyrimidine photo-lyase, partial [Solirubrobacteraceae bacterium]|nr:deoxyribodipyrimidine photo-lyase [Solirubrobacteraceae bacterium]
MAETALLWFRRDLRVADHPALTLAAREFKRVVPVFVLDDALLHGRFASSPRTAFMLGCLRALDEALRERGSGLVVRHGRPQSELVA